MVGRASTRRGQGRDRPLDRPLAGSLHLRHRCEQPRLRRRPCASLLSALRTVLAGHFRWGGWGGRARRLVRQSLCGRAGAQFRDRMGHGAAPCPYLWPGMGLRLALRKAGAFGGGLIDWPRSWGFGGEEVSAAELPWWRCIKEHAPGAGDGTSGNGCGSGRHAWRCWSETTTRRTTLT